MKALPISFVLICLLLQLKSLPSFSQATFTTVPAPNGSWGGAAVGTQDRDGFMWFGSTGLHKFDGYKYTSYYHDPSDSTSLCLNRVMSVYADSEGTIWVGTTGAGLDRLDPETGIFTHFRSDSLDSRTLSSDWVWTILEDRHGKIWVGTEYGGISILDPDTNTITQFRHDPDDANSLSNNFVRVLYEDREGTMWVGTGYPYTLEAAEWKGGGLNRFNPTTQNFTHFVHNPNDPASLIDNRIGSILEDSKGRFWVGTAGDGLHTMDRENGTFKRYPYDAAVPNNLSRPQVRNTISWLEDHICFIQEDIIGNIWIGTLTGGLNCFDAETNKVTHYNSLGENQKDSNQINNFFWSYTSKDG
ncbi:MAG TPA: two-component regulator propeller domain-containing protein, partial [Chryseolinea sp.]|nr:two-component regulator propeller domain-containing protein [Chryseolinea sp.]